MNMNIFKALFKENKKGQFNILSTSAIALIIFAVVVTVGTVIVQTIGSNVSNCASQIPNGAFNTSTNTCTNGSLGATPTSVAPTATPWVSANFITGAFGSTGGGLASWTIIIVTVIVGSILIGLISGAFGRGRQ